MLGRKPRIWMPDQFYHIVARGNRREPLFHDPGDYHIFCYIMKQVYLNNAFELASFCLMTNHYHLQIRSVDQPLSKVIGLFNKRYADYYNTKYSVTGHVFEKRYFDSVILDKEGMLKVSRYIHMNPVEAGMVDIPEQYPYSSYQTMFSDDKRITMPYFDVKLILGYFSGNNRIENVQAYRAYMDGVELENSGACGHFSDFV
ncbi:transposase [Paraliobacillus quinghaiensis]|uniref:transposase n=1 Tax=Paraliobacillus quinghaiensis TaxID=470815 RepID=UPI0027E5B508|nr:transposase [Paraliobacillus quinghaiensis]